MLSDDVRLQWWRDSGGYKLVGGRALVEIANTRPGSMQKQVSVRDEFVVGRTGKLSEFKSLNAFDGLLYSEFARVKDSRTALEFVNHFAPLTSDGFRPKGERVSTILGHARKLRRYLDVYSQKHPKLLLELIGLPGEPLGTLDLALKPNFRAKRMEMWSVPKDLITLIWIQFGTAVTGGVRITACEHCSSLFESGPGTGRRLDAQFCSDEHRIAFNSLKRSRKK